MIMAHPPLFVSVWFREMIQPFGPTYTLGTIKAQFPMTLCNLQIHWGVVCKLILDVHKSILHRPRTENVGSLENTYHRTLLHHITTSVVAPRCLFIEPSMIKYGSLHRIITDTTLLSNMWVCCMIRDVHVHSFLTTDQILETLHF